jgi:hypothetical protein
VQRSDRLNVAVLFNQRVDPSGKKYEAIRDLLDCADSLARGYDGGCGIPFGVSGIDTGQGGNAASVSSSIDCDESKP